MPQKLIVTIRPSLPHHRKRRTRLQKLFNLALQS